jgi:hypothetical protein
VPGILNVPNTVLVVTETAAQFRVSTVSTVAVHVLVLAPRPEVWVIGGNTLAFAATSHVGENFHVELREIRVIRGLLALVQVEGGGHVRLLACGVENSLTPVRGSRNYRLNIPQEWILMRFEFVFIDTALG